MTTDKLLIFSSLRFVMGEMALIVSFRGSDLVCKRQYLKVRCEHRILFSVFISILIFLFTEQNKLGSAMPSSSFSKAYL